MSAGKSCFKESLGISGKSFEECDLPKNKRGGDWNTPRSRVVVSWMSVEGKRVCAIEEITEKRKEPILTLVPLENRVEEKERNIASVQ